jgi:hypothetical protein
VKTNADMMRIARRYAFIESMLERVPVWDVRSDWRDLCLCKGCDPNLALDSEDGFVRGFCESCPVRQDCLTDQLRLEQQLTLFEVLGAVAVRSETRRSWLSEQERVPAPIRHGSPAGYQQHRRRGEIACKACKDAHNIDKVHREAERRAS